MFAKRFHLGHLLLVTITAAILVAMLSLLPTPTKPATDSATLDLTGTVAADVDVSVTALPIAGTLNLSAGHTETSLKLADVTERSNVPAGYTVTVTSANLAAGGRCTGAAGQACIYNAAGARDVPFSLLKGAASQTFTASSATWTDVNGVQLTDLASVANVAYSVASGLVLPQGAYSETLTFTITSK